MAEVAGEWDGAADVSVAALIAWLPNSSSYDGAEGSDDHALLHRCLQATIVSVGTQCGYLGQPDDDLVIIDTETGEVVQPNVADWPVPVKQALIMVAADLYAARQRPGVLEVGTYSPRNWAAERLLSPYIEIGFS